MSLFIVGFVGHAALLNCQKCHKFLKGSQVSRPGSRHLFDVVCSPDVDPHKGVAGASDWPQNFPGT